MTLPQAGASEPDAVRTLLQAMLARFDAGWSIGTFGALAEFHHVEGDPPPQIRLTNCGGEVVTRRGGLCVELTDGARPVAYEGLRRPQGWSQTLSFCVPTECAQMSGHVGLTECGPDRHALRPADRHAILFDLGLAAPHIDFCIRTADAGLIDILRRATGQSLLAPHHPAMAAVVAASPHRVCRSRLGRIEVYQAIPPPVPDSRSPIGPHTHLLPDLLKSGRRHSANAPIPDGQVAALDLHPANPLCDPLGVPRPFDAEAYRAFQAMLAAYGAPGLASEKARIAAAVQAGGAPSGYRVATSRIGRTAARIALRQLRHADPEPPNLASWLTAFDRAAEAAETVDACG
jgi:hypothetical protein